MQSIKYIECGSENYPTRVNLNKQILILGDLVGVVIVCFIMRFGNKTLTTNDFDKNGLDVKRGLL